MAAVKRTSRLAARHARRFTSSTAARDSYWVIEAPSCSIPAGSLDRISSAVGPSLVSASNKAGRAYLQEPSSGRKARGFQRGLAVRRLQDLIALRRQPHPQQFADRRLVVDDQHFDRAALMRRYPMRGPGP